MEFRAQNKFLSRALLIGGIFTMIIGVAHIFMPTFGYSPQIFNSMEANVRDHFYYLATYAICGFLLTLGLISIYFSKLKSIKDSFMVSALLTVLWISRLVLEYFYPVEVSLFFIKSPHKILFSAIAFIVITYLIGTLSFIKFNKPQKKVE
ncbi:hypothetical protein [Yeosuana marina]|uniref:hypothetical protein n=1 Tax=Yeosuana marina TaxID=1565536 RepID=UPI001422CC45|nr:hypothetical protein [Yeosuana marina]